MSGVSPVCRGPGLGGQIEEGGDDVLHLSFTDRGSGMTKEQLGDMFTPFKTSKATGNGLGMMIIQRVCREHGAEFGVNSKPEEGTTVSIRFPLGGRRIRVLPPG